MEKINLNVNRVHKKKLVIIDLLQGVAMVWVIIGHHLFDFMPAIYQAIHYYIYSFHMPFFIFISSFLIAYSYKEVPYRTYVYKKFHKFFLPYVLVGIMVIALSALKEGIRIVPNNILYLIFSPKQSEATFLWYIYLLFILYAIYPLCRIIFNRWKVAIEILLLSMGLYFYFSPLQIQILCVDYFTKYFLFYGLGIMTAWHFNIIRKHIKQLKIIGLCCLVCFVLLSASVFIVPQNITYVAICFCAIPAMYSVVKVVSHQQYIKKALIAISKNCFHIYLIHMFFIQGVAFVFMKLHPFKIESAGVMVVYLLVSSFIAIIGPVFTFRIIDYVKSRF